ncbi:MAG: DUF4398 domain-containing protein [Polyangiales bacterium]
MNKTILCVIGLFAVGCAHHPAPTDRVATSLAATRGAEEAGAAEVPEAALHVKLAVEQLDQAKALMKDEENLRAEDKALRAGEDAELALSLARLHTSRQKLERFTGDNPPASGGEAPDASPREVAP